LRELIELFPIEIGPIIRVFIYLLTEVIYIDPFGEFYESEIEQL
jgi:hypothetical protein